MKFVFASDSFKGSLTGEKINQILTKAAKKYFPEAELIPLLIADGGEGTLEAVISQKHGEFIPLCVSDPLGRRIQSRYGVFGDAAMICMSEASGLPMLSESERGAGKTTTYGTGELIRHAVESVYKKIFVPLGGSATNDGGMGALNALGYAFYDKDGNLLYGDKALWG